MAVGWEGRVVGTDAVVNVGAPVDAARGARAAYHGRLAAWPDGRTSRVALVHAPRRLRVDGVAAAVARVPRGRVATVVAVTRADVMTGLLRHVHASLTGAGIRDMLCAAADKMAYDAASGLAPYRVLLGSAPSVAASLVGRGEAVFLVSCRSVVVDGDAYGNALARVAGAAGVSGGGCGDGAGGDAAPRSTLPVFIPPWPPAVPATVTAWANASSTVTLPSLLATASIPCAPCPHSRLRARGPRAPPPTTPPSSRPTPCPAVLRCAH